MKNNEAKTNQQHPMSPKPPSLAELGQEALAQVQRCYGLSNCESEVDIIRRALERLQELEGADEPTFTSEEIEMIEAPWSLLQSQQELEGEQ